MFTTDDILKRVKQQPFIPLRIITSSGDQYDIYHPDLIMVGKRHLVVGTASEDNPMVYDQVSMLSLLHIAALENLPSSQNTGQGNGQ